jgi:predicted N-acetyltransferase YhbS
MLECRAEQPDDDIEAIRRFHVAAFGREDEAILVDQLRQRHDAAIFPFVAVDESEQIVVVVRMVECRAEQPEVYYRPR